MSYYMICPNCGKGTIGRYATDNDLCGECSDNSSTTDKLSVEKLQEQLNTAKKALTEIAEFEPKKSAHKYWPDWHSIMMTTASEALAAIGGDDE